LKHVAGRLEGRANKLQVPFMYSHFLYTLRAHIDFVRARLMKQNPESAALPIVIAGSAAMRSN